MEKGYVQASRVRVWGKEGMRTMRLEEGKYGPMF